MAQAFFVFQSCSFRLAGQHGSRHEVNEEGCDEASDEGYESNEGHESDESNEGNEEGKESQQDCEGERSEGCSAEGQERKNSWRIYQRKSGEEQEGQGCVQECLGSQQEDLRLESPEEVGRGMQESTKGFGHHWLLRSRRQQCPGQSTLRQSEVHPGRQVMTCTET